MDPTQPDNIDFIPGDPPKNNSKCPCGNCCVLSAWCPVAKVFAPVRDARKVEVVKGWKGKVTQVKVRHWDWQNRYRWKFPLHFEKDDFRKYDHPSFKPYMVLNKEGDLRPSTGHVDTSPMQVDVGYCQIEDRLNEWKHDLPVGSMKLSFLLLKFVKKRVHDMYKPGSKLSLSLKRKWDAMGSLENDERNHDD